MEYLKNKRNIGIISIIALGLVIVFGVKDSGTFGQTGIQEQSCTASTSKVTIGHQLSTQVLATSSRRAWARIQIDQNATNTVALTLNDVTATLNNGILINQALTNGASTTPFLEFGLNTQAPYVGAVKAITNLGSTTALVTQCTY